MHKNIMRYTISNILYIPIVTFILFLYSSCDSARNQEQTLTFSSDLEEIIFPVEDPTADTTKYEVLLFDTTLDYMVKKKIYDTAQTANIFIEDLKVTNFSMKLTRDILKDSLLYVHEYCTSVDVVLRYLDQEKLICSASLKNENPDYFNIRFPSNIGILKLGKVYMKLNYNYKIKTKRYFKYDMTFQVRYSYDDN